MSEVAKKSGVVEEVKVEVKAEAKVEEVKAEEAPAIEETPAE